MSIVTFAIIVALLFIAFFAAESYFIGSYANETDHPTYHATEHQLLKGVLYNGGQNGLVTEVSYKGGTRKIVLVRKQYIAPRQWMAFYQEVPAV